MSRPSRNVPCPCGSGLKYKRCCLEAEERVARQASFDDAVGLRIQTWASDVFGDELEAALVELTGPERVLYDDDVEVLSLWFHNDRELAGGGTPAERYAALPGLDPAEREAASRIASARLGLYRVLEVEAGRALTLEPLTGGKRLVVPSPTISREAVRWDILLTHVMAGEGPGLWGASRFFEPVDEIELRAELERLAGSPLDQLDENALGTLYRRHALELLRFIPPSRRAEPSFYTLEGDPVAFATATWRVDDVPAAEERLRELGGLDADEPLEVELTMKRSTLVARRPPLPPGAMLLESSMEGGLAVVSIATLTLDGDELRAEAISQERLDQVLEGIDDDFGDLVALVGVDVKSVEEARATTADRQREPEVPVPPHVERRLIERFADERMLLWLDEPHPALDGRTPRQAATGPARGEVVRLFRQLENGAERSRRDGKPAADVSLLRAELGLEDELAA